MPIAFLQEVQINHKCQPDFSIIIYNTLLCNYSILHSSFNLLHRLAVCWIAIFL